MTKTKQTGYLQSRTALYVVAGAIAVSIMSIASLAHADEGRDRTDRGNRGANASVKSFLSINLKDILGMHREKREDRATTTKQHVDVVSGSVSSVSVTGNTLVLTGNGTTTVSVSGDTKINGTATTLAGITAGDRVKAHGTLNTSTNVFVADKLTVNHNVMTQADAQLLLTRLENFIAQLKLRFSL